MKVAIVNCFDTYEDRIDLLHEFFAKKGYDVSVIQSDFRHFKKVKRTDIKKDYTFVQSKPYYKNMSITRMTSHYDYAKKAFEVVESLKPDLLYVLVPPNSLAKFAAKYKRDNSNVKLIFDLIDLWPETIPIGKIKYMPPFSFWGSMREKSMKFADYVITECDLYQEVLENTLKGIKTKTIYLAKRDSEIISKPILNDKEIHLCYLGSINNIIDIDKIKTIARLINERKPVTFHIIGDGESRETLIKEVKATGAKVEYYGKIYDPQIKQNIFDKCHFGLNIMKETVCVGLTMKSIDYFQAGLPIINSIQADTSRVVEKFNIGMNIKADDIEKIVDKVLNIDKEELVVMRKAVREVFNSLFSVKAFNEKLEMVIKEL